MTDRLNEALAALVDREPTAEEVSRFHRIKDTLGLAEHDVVWTFLVAFGHYELLYEAIPEKIKHASMELIAAQRALLEPAAKAVESQLFASVEKNATKTVERVVEEALRGAKTIQDSLQRRRLGIAFAVSAGVAALVVGLAVWGGFEAGRASRNGDMSWLDSSEGQAVRRFAQLNDVKAMLACEEPLARQQAAGKEHCVPYEKTTKQVRMWRIN